MSKSEKQERWNKVRAASTISESVVEEWRAAKTSMGQPLYVNSLGVIMDKWEVEGNLKDALWSIQRALEKLKKFQEPSEDDYKYHCDEDE